MVSDYKKAFEGNIHYPDNLATRNVLDDVSNANGGYFIPIEFEYILLQVFNENKIIRTIGCKIINYPE